MAISNLRPGLILFASALPLLTRLAMITLASAGHIDELGLRLLYMPVDVLLFAVGFSIALLAGTGLRRSTVIVRSVLFSISLFCVNAALSIGYFFFGLILMVGAAAFLAPGLQAGLCLLLYGFFVGHFLGHNLDRSSYIRLFVVGAIAGSAPLIAARLFPTEFALPLANSAWYLAAGLALFLESKIASGEQKSSQSQQAIVEPAVRKRRSGLSLKYGLGLAFVPPLLLLAVTIGGMFMSFDGYCYGFTDGKWSCSVWESMGNQLGFALLFFSVPVFGWVGLVLFMTDFRSVLRQGA